MISVCVFLLFCFFLILEEEPERKYRDTHLETRGYKIVIFNKLIIVFKKKLVNLTNKWF